MANITAHLHPASGNSKRGRGPYYVDVTIDLTKNSIAPGDTIQAITVPANTLVMAAGFQVVESATMNTATDATAALGTTGTDPDEFAAALDIDGASDGDYAPQVAHTGLVLSSSATETIDFVLTGSGASFTAGKLRAFALLLDISDQGDMTADEVDRDTLA